MPGNAQAEGLCTLISSGEWSKPAHRRGMWTDTAQRPRPLISQVYEDRGAADQVICHPDILTPEQAWD